MSNTEVYDDAEIAEMTEFAARQKAEFEIRSQVFQGSKEDAEKLFDPTKECEECGILIVKERQVASPLSKYCTECHDWYEKENKRKSFLKAQIFQD